MDVKSISRHLEITLASALFREMAYLSELNIRFGKHLISFKGF